MASREILGEGLFTGEQMARQVFLRRLEALDDFKNAERVKEE